MTRPYPIRIERGASLVEFIVAAPVLVILALGLVQTGLIFHAKSNVNYASFEAARAGAVHHADPGAIDAAFKRAMIPYYGGGRNLSELSQAYAALTADFAQAQTQLGRDPVRIEILSPSLESFNDYHSPALATQLKVATRVIPNTLLNILTCPKDRPGCANNPASNQSGQTLADANLLKLRVTYGIPARKQLPMIGKFMTRVLPLLNPNDRDAFRAALLAAERLPVVSHVTVRMQSEAFENAVMASLPGPGNNGTPTDPGPPPPPVATLPPCSIGDPLCTPKPCDPTTDPNGCRPPGCAQGDSSCDPGCGRSYCCLPDQGSVNAEGTPVAASPTSNASVQLKS